MCERLCTAHPGPASGRHTGMNIEKKRNAYLSATWERFLGLLCCVHRPLLKVGASDSSGDGGEPLLCPLRRAELGAPPPLTQCLLTESGFSQTDILECPTALCVEVFYSWGNAGWVRGLFCFLKREMDEETLVLRGL